MNPLIREYLWRYRARIGGGLLCSLAATGLGLTMPWMLRNAIDVFSTGGPDATRALAGYAVGIVVLAVFEALARFASRLLVTGASRWVESDLRGRYFAHLERFEPAFFHRHRTGDLVARATNDLSAVRQLFGPALYHVVGTFLLLVITIVLMFEISSTLAISVLAVLPVALMVFIATRTRLERRFALVQEQFGAMADHSQETFAGERVVKAYAQEAAEIETFRRTSLEYVRRQLSQIRLSGLLWPTMSFVIGLLIALLLYAGGREVVEGRLSIGQLVQFNAYVAMLSWPTMAMGWVATMWQQGAASLRRIQSILDERPAIADPVAPSALPPAQGEVELRSVTLEIGGKTILRDVSLKVPAGSSVAILGALGSGKSSLVSLIGRLVDPSSGAVLLDGIDVRDMPLAELRQRLGYVPQETFLFSGSLRDNITFGLAEEEVTENRVRGAIRLSQLEKDLDQWPAGLETVVGERGVTLSGGQKQRVALARAVVRDPAVLIMDDALSSVDTRTEEAILTGLGHFTAHRTSIIIAHRLSTTRLAKRVVVLHEGRVVEEGSHRELLQRRGHYARMYRRQLIAQELDLDERDERVAPGAVES